MYTASASSCWRSSSRNSRALCAPTPTRQQCAPSHVVQGGRRDMHRWCMNHARCVYHISVNTTHRARCLRCSRAQSVWRISPQNQRPVVAEVAGAQAIARLVPAQARPLPQTARRCSTSRAATKVALQQRAASRPCHARRWRCRAAIASAPPASPGATACHPHRHL